MYFSKNIIYVGILYNLGIYFLGFILQIVALFNEKIRLGVKGRNETFKKLNQHLKKEDNTLWLHCASLGEFEQGLPVFKELRTLYPNHKIVLSFFSPSGYEIRKNTDVADLVVYLPLDTKSNAKRFIDLVKPELTIFVKYDIWPNMLNALNKRKLRAILISATFRKNQSYFKFYGSKTKKALHTFEHIFVQNKSSKTLANTLGLKNVTVAGDTRFDRVSNQLNQDNTLDFISNFKQDKLCVVIGSSWPEDEELLIKFINNNQNLDVKYIIAPHNIKATQIQNITKNLNTETVLFSQKEGKLLSNYSVFVIDTIGLLSKIYAYADIAYVGGAMGNTGLHNILEPAVFGVPIIIGSNYKNFPEAYEMIDNGGLVSIKNFNELEDKLQLLIENKDKRLQQGTLNLNFIKKNKGAVIQIINYIRK